MIKYERTDFNNFCFANLNEANLEGADFRGADIINFSFEDLEDE